MIKPIISAATLLKNHRKMVKDGTLADAIVAARRPANVGKGRWGVAVRMKGELLNARKNAVEAGLDYRQDRPRSTPTLAPRYFITVKATSAKQAEQGRMGWLERTWRISPLWYSQGFIIISEIGTESNVFPSPEHALTAIRRSGWEIVTKTAVK